MPFIQIIVHYLAQSIQIIVPDLAQTFIQIMLPELAHAPHPDHCALLGSISSDHSA
jgi:hypothetical protein